MNSYSPKVGQTIFYRRWLWLIERRLDKGWRLKRLGDGERHFLDLMRFSELIDGREIVVLGHATIFSRPMHPEQLRSIVDQISNAIGR